MKPVIKATTAIYNAGGFNFVFEVIRQTSQALGELHYYAGQFRRDYPEDPYKRYHAMSWDDIVGKYAERYKLELIPFDPKTDCAVNSDKLEQCADFVNDVLDIFNVHREYVLDYEDRSELKRIHSLAPIVAAAWTLNQFECYTMKDSDYMRAIHVQLLENMHAQLVSQASKPS